MIVSHENVKKFLLDVVRQSSFPGEIVEFVAAVKKELAAAEIEKPKEEVQP
jgi:hypothetical protein